MGTSSQKQPPMDDYDRLTAVITERYPSLSPQLQKIAHFVLENPNETALETVASLAHKAGVQPSSMVRFAQAIGYSGFLDLQSAFQSRLVSPGRSYRERIEALRQSRGSSADLSLDAIMANFVGGGISSLQLLRDDTSLEAMERAVHRLRRAKHTYVIAERRAFPVAFYIYYSLLRLDLRAHLVDGVGGTLQQQTDLATPQDVVFGISFPPYAPAVAEAFARAEERGVPTIAMTDSVVSKLALKADVTLTVRQPETPGFRSLVAPICLAQILIVALGAKLSDRRGAKH